MRPRKASLVLLMGLACAGRGVDLQALPDAPIAFVHRNLEESDQRAEALAREDRQASKPGTLRLNDVSELLGLGASPAERRAAQLGHLALADPRTGRVERISAALPGARPLCWSGDRDRLLFVSWRRERPQLYEYSLARRDVRALTRGPDAHPFGCYGPEGQLVVARVAVVGEGVISRLFVHEQGQRPRALTEGPGDSKPVWSPGGSILAFETLGPDGQSAIAVIDPDGEQRRLLAPGRDPVFTPDGEWIVWSAPSRGRWRLWRMRADGSGKRRLGESVFDEHDPAVAPDGRYLVFVAEEPDTVAQQLMVRPLEGGGLRPLLGRDEGMSPAW
ncbi:MAG: hypothetical protein ABFS46_04205 [Myxococcota bacterium]